MRHLIKILPIAVAIFFTGCLAAACGQSGGGAIASFSPSRTASISPPSRTATISPPSPSASISPPSPSASVSTQPSATHSATAPATITPSSSGAASSSSLIWLWVVIGALALIGLIVGIARVSGRRSAAAAKWQSGVSDAYAESAALYDAMRAAETPTALAAQDAGARWLDIQRRADDVTRTLCALREAAPDEDKRALVSDVLASVQGARSAMDAERAPGEADGQNAQVVRSRLLSFEASIRALRAPDDPRL